MDTVTFAGHRLSEFGAKLLSYPQISPCEIDLQYFQGVSRSTLIPLVNRRKAKTLTFLIDFLCADNVRRTKDISAFETLFTSNDAVTIDIGDGFLYSGFLTESSDLGTEGELITSMEYVFVAMRHTQSVKVDCSDGEIDFLCESNYPKTDCRITIDLNVTTGGAFTVLLNTNMLTFVIPEVTSQLLGKQLVLDGINKVFLLDGNNITAQVDWTDFPYLLPGKNTVFIGVSGVVITLPFSVEYTPTYL